MLVCRASGIVDGRWAWHDTRICDDGFVLGTIFSPSNEEYAEKPPPPPTKATLLDLSPSHIAHRVSRALTGKVRLLPSISVRKCFLSSLSLSGFYCHIGKLKNGGRGRRAEN